MVSELGDLLELENGQPKLDSNGIPIPTEREEVLVEELALNGLFRLTNIQLY